MEDGFQCFRPEFSALLVEGRGGWGIRLQVKEIEQFFTTLSSDEFNFC